MQTEAQSGALAGTSAWCAALAIIGWQYLQAHTYSLILPLTFELGMTQICCISIYIDIDADSIPQRKNELCFMTKSAVHATVVGVARGLCGSRAPVCQKRVAAG